MSARCQLIQHRWWQHFLWHWLSLSRAKNKYWGVKGRNWKPVLSCLGRSVLWRLGWVAEGQKIMCDLREVFWGHVEREVWVVLILPSFPPHLWVLGMGLVLFWGLGMWEGDPGWDLRRGLSRQDLPESSAGAWGETLLVLEAGQAPTTSSQTRLQQGTQAQLSVLAFYVSLHVLFQDSVFPSSNYPHKQQQKNPSKIQIYEIIIFFCSCGILGANLWERLLLLSTWCHGNGHFCPIFVLLLIFLLCLEETAPWSCLWGLWEALWCFLVVLLCGLGKEGDVARKFLLNVMLFVTGNTVDFLVISLSKLLSLLLLITKWPFGGVQPLWSDESPSAGWLNRGLGAYGGWRCEYSRPAGLLWWSLCRGFVLSDSQKPSPQNVTGAGGNYRWRCYLFTAFQNGLFWNGATKSLSCLMGICQARDALAPPLKQNKKKSPIP